MTCAHCESRKGLYSMNCYGCVLRLIEEQPHFRRRAMVVHSIGVCPPDVAERVRHHYAPELAVADVRAAARQARMRA